jgi:hypothetical protein
LSDQREQAGTTPSDRAESPERSQSPIPDGTGLAEIQALTARVARESLFQTPGLGFARGKMDRRRVVGIRGGTGAAASKVLTVDLGQAGGFLRGHHCVVLAARLAGGGIQQSPVLAYVDGDGARSSRVARPPTGCAAWFAPAWAQVPSLR